MKSEDIKLRSEVTDFDRAKVILSRLKYLDVKRFKYIDGEIDEATYLPYGTEAIALRLEYKALEVTNG